MSERIRNDIIDAFLKRTECNVDWLLREAGHHPEDDPCYGMDDNANDERRQEEFAMKVMKEIAVAVRAIKSIIPDCQHQWDVVQHRHYNGGDVLVRCRKCNKRSVEEEMKREAANASFCAYI
jgi:hypothetical protein